MVKYSMDLSSISTIIIGLGKTGLSVARYLKRQNKPFAVCDTRTKFAGIAQFRQSFPEVPIFCGPLDENLLQQAQQLIVSPGIAIDLPAISAAAKAGVEVIGDIELFARAVEQPVIAITGSNGKTTVTTLVTEMAQAANLQVGMGGNIGTPVLDLLTQHYDLFVLELSSFQLETTYSLQTVAAVNLNISDDHLDRYSSLITYAAAKHKIYQQAKTAVLNLDDPLAWEQADISGNCIGFTLNANKVKQFKNVTAFFTVKNDQIICNQELWLPVKALRLQTRHQLANILASFALGYAVKFPQSAMLPVATSFAGLPHRCQEIMFADHIIWLNDSKATNVGAALAAINSVGQTITGKIILIAGGDGKSANFSPLAPSVTKFCRMVILLGKDAVQLAASLNHQTEIQYVQNLTEAVVLAKRFAKAGDAVLLSPACSSLDMFVSYAARGEQFVDAVKKILE